MEWTDINRRGCHTGVGHKVLQGGGKMIVAAGLVYLEGQKRQTKWFLAPSCVRVPI